MTTHVFVVDQYTFKYHLEYLFAGTGAKDKKATFLTLTNSTYNSTTERMLVGMIADISRVHIGDNVVFYLQATANSPGLFFGVFKVASEPFFDENDFDNFLASETKKGLSFRVLLEPSEVYSKGINEHEYLDSLDGKLHPYDLCWSLIYRKLKGNRGCTMLMDYEYSDLLTKLRKKNNNRILSATEYTFDSSKFEIAAGSKSQPYIGRKDSLSIFPRLQHKALRNNAFETHLQAYILQNINSDPLKSLLYMLTDEPCWIGNEVSCGVGMQRIDLMIKQENKTDVYIRLIELKDEQPYEEIVTKQIPWYLKWLTDYITPNYSKKKVHIIPTVLAKGALPLFLDSTYKGFKYSASGVQIEALQYIGFDVTASGITFNKYL